MTTSKNTFGIVDAFEKIEDSILSQQSQLDSLSQRLSDIELRDDEIDKRINSLENHVQEQAKKLDEFDDKEEIDDVVNDDTETSVSCWQWIQEVVCKKSA